MSWGMPALYFMGGRRSPSPPPLPEPESLSSRYSPTFPTSSSSPSSPSSPPPSSAWWSPPLFHGSQSPPPACPKPLKRKASRSIATPEDADTQLPHTLHDLHFLFSARPSADRLLPAIACSPLPSPTGPSTPPAASHWRFLPPFLPASLLPFLSGRSLASALRQSRAWHADFFLGNAQSSTQSRVCVDVDELAAAAGEESEEFAPFSVPCAQSLRALFHSGVAHGVHTLRLSTVRLGKDACRLLSSFLLLAHLELRLFESVAEDWYTDFLSSDAPLIGGMDAAFLHGALFNVGCSSFGCSENERAAVQACARALRASVRRLCHLRSLTVVDYVDEADNEDWPNLGAQSSAILSALHCHPHLALLELRRPRFSHSSLSSNTFTAERLSGIPHLRTLTIVDAALLPQAQCDELLRCAQLTELRVTHSEPHTPGAASQLFSANNVHRLASAWPQLSSLMVESVVVGGRHPSSFSHSSLTKASLPSQQSPPTSTPSSPALTPSSSTDDALSIAGTSPPTASSARLHLSQLFTSLASFEHLSSLHLTFASPPPASARLSLLDATLDVDAEVWQRCWDPASSTLARSLQHLTLSIVPGAHMSALLRLPLLRSLRLLGPHPCTDELLSALTDPQPSTAPTSLNRLELALASEQETAMKAWTESLTARGGCDPWPALEMVDGVSAVCGSIMVQWKRQ